MNSSDPVAVLRAAAGRLPGPVRDGLKRVWHARGRGRARRSLRTVDPAVTAWGAANRRPVSIVIPSYNDIPLLTACLRSIEKTLAGTEYEVIVVDDYCQPENSARLARLAGERVRVVFKEKRMGFAVTVNRGMELAAHDIVLLNSDIVALDGWLDGLQLAAYGRDEPVGLVSPRLLYPDGRIQYGGTFWARSWVPQWFAHRYAGQFADHAPAMVPSYNWGASGACLYITRDTYDELGGLDETYWLGFEDVDYAMRSWVSGRRSVYEPRSVLYHHESATRGRHQGNRELASMRHFWASWSQLHTTKTGGVPTRHVDLVADSSPDGLWQPYLDAAAASLRERGWEVEVHTIDDEDELIARLSPRPSLKVATSIAALRAVWLSSVTTGIPVAMIGTLGDGPTPETIAALAPEFDYVAANQWIGSTLTRLTSWPVSATVAPALPVDEAAVPVAGPLVVLTADRARDADAIGVITAIDPEAILVEAPTIGPEVIERVRESAPGVVVSLLDPGRSLEPLALMALGAAYIGLESDRTLNEVMNGLNALLVERRDLATLNERVRGVLGDPEHRAALGQNGLDAARRASAEASEALDLALRAIAFRRA